MILSVDIGNTSTRYAIFESTKLRRVSYRLEALVGKRPGIQAVIYVSVNPDRERQILHLLRCKFGLKPLKLGRDLAFPIKVRYSPPSSVGADRLANAVAAYELARRMCMVIDLGTAITFDVVSKRGEFLGGAIAPGLGLLARALSRGCALLPEIHPARPRHLIGKDTTQNIRIGTFWGVVGAIKQITVNITDKLGKRPYIFGTGADANLFAGLGLFDTIRPYLTLEGIAISYLKNVGPR